MAAHAAVGSPRGLRPGIHSERKCAGERLPLDAMTATATLEATMPHDVDPLESQEWREALDSVLEFDGPDRACGLLEELIGRARRHGAPVPYSANTPYLNTIPPGRQVPYPGDQQVEHVLRSI